MRVVKNLYYKISSFKRNIFETPANLNGKRFLDFHHETLSWYLKEGPQKHIVWWAKSILPTRFLQNVVQKARHVIDSKILKDCLKKMSSGQMYELISDLLSYTPFYPTESRTYEQEYF